MIEQKFHACIVADWLVSYSGAERVIASIMESVKCNSLFSVIDFLKSEDRVYFGDVSIHTTFIQKLPNAKNKYPKYLPLMPLAIEQLDVSEADVVISSSHAVAKGVLTGPDQLHISYVHSPMRYAWDLQHQYLRESGLNKGFKGFLAKWILHKLRMWDYRTANGVDYFIANSQFIARRIKKIYGRDATVIYPPVSIKKFNCITNKDDFYLTASRLVPYKRVDLIVKAFKKMPQRKLVVIGQGSDFNKIKHLAKGSKNIEILGYQSFDVLKSYMEKAKAFIFAAEEDFGITPVEAQACGTPVIAYGKGGVLETVRPLGELSPTGIFFENQNYSSLCDTIDLFEKNINVFTASSCRKNASRFSEARFKKEFSEFVEKKWIEFEKRKKIIY
ncbi:glycosyltransferase family 4 protein [Celerinatantimonas sp. MCCC 1A17872]|uniref:glycosyltransferase family 4 protein n=1 Tax=Celerinatantimonas sp. MCCC 1A17872 TaxID=3177514 RepID=UPI0038C59C2C